MYDQLKKSIVVVGSDGKMLMVADSVVMQTPSRDFMTSFCIILERVVVHDGVLMSSISEARRALRLPGMMGVGAVRLMRVYRGIAGEAQREVFARETARAVFAVDVGFFDMSLDGKGRIRALCLVPMECLVPTERVCSTR